MKEMAAEGERADVVFMDPPRAGSDEAFLSSLIRLSPERVVLYFLQSGNPGEGYEVSGQTRLPGAGSLAGGYVPVDRFHRGSGAPFQVSRAAGARKQRPQTDSENILHQLVLA